MELQGKPTVGTHTKKILKKIIRTELQNTRFHEPLIGLIYIRDNNRCVSFRLLWIFILFICIVICSFLTHDRLQYYHTYPIRVDVTYSYSAPHPMPSVTLCAQNTHLWIDYLNNNPDLASDLKKYNANYPCAQLLLLLYKFLHNVTIDGIWEMFNTSLALESSQLFKENVPLRGLESSSKNLPMGSCLKFDYDKEVVNDADRLDLRIKSFKVGCDRVSRIMMTFQKNHYDTNLHQFWHVPTNLRVEVVIRLLEYNFVTTKIKKCVSWYKYDQCSRECFKKVYKNIRKIIPCRHPFQPDYLGTPLCKEPSFDFYLRSLFVAIRFDPIFMCKCPKLCHEYAYIINLYYYSQHTSLSRIRIKKRLYKTTFNEKKVYDVITLLCDIGGNLGLLLGLSVLSACDIIHCFVSWIRAKSWKLALTAKPHKQIIKDLLRKKVVKCKSSNVSSICSRTIRNNKLKTINIPMAIVYSVFVICSLYVICDRSVHFMRFPTTSVVYVQNNDTAIFPVVTICAPNYYMEELRLKYLNEANEDPCKMLDHFLDISETDVQDLWNKSATADVIKMQHSSAGARIAGLKFFMTSVFSKSPLDRPHFINMPTVEGMCIQYDIGEHKLYGTTTFLENVVISQPKVACKKSVISVFIMPRDIPNPFLLRARLDIPTNQIGLVSLRFRELIKLNTQDHYCTDRDSSINCVARCHEKLLYKQIKCRLPFMPANNNLPFCLNSSSATRARKIYQTIYEHYPSKECECLPSCNELIYYYIDFIEPNEEKFTYIHIFFSTNLFETVKEIYAYTWVKFICDIGAVLSVGLGFSVLIFFETIQYLINCFISCRR